MEHFIMAFTPTSFIGARRVRNWSLSFATLVLLFANPTQLLSQNSTANAPSSSANAANGGAKAANASANAAISAFPATTVNSQLPGWLRFSGEYRLRPEDHTAYGFVGGADDGFLLSRLRLNLTATASDSLSFFVQAQDSHALGIDSSHVTTSINDTFDLRQAYIQLTPKSWIRVRAGRQEFRFGSERLIGVSDWTNAPRVFDAIRLTLGTANNHVDIFTSSVVVNDPIHFDNHNGGLTFHGLYGSLSHAVPKATLEPYLLWKALPLVTSEEGTKSDESLFTYGGRWIGKLPLGFDYAGEAARQGGYYANDNISAWGGYAMLGYTISKAPLSPRVSAQYDYASGDHKKGDGTVGTFDQLYPSNHGVFGLVDLLGWRNVRQLRTGIDFKPISHLTTAVDYRNIDLASRYDGLYGSTGSTLVKAPKGGALSTDVGHEFDLSGKYQLRKNVDTGAGYGHLFAGSFLTQNSHGSSPSIVYTYVTYKF
jgi:hypothetical protein